MEHKTSTFEDHLRIVEAGHEKTASKSISGKASNTLLQKLAEELGAAPTAEGERELPGQNVSTTSPEVAAATDGVTIPQIAVAGGDPANQAAGMLAHMNAPFGAAVPIATGEGTLTIAQNLNKTEEAVAAAARGAGGAQGESLEAEKVGQIIAQSFQESLAKAAEDQDYPIALEILKEAELLDNYKINDTGIVKTASQTSALEKIANNQPLSKADIIAAASEYVELEKQAVEADAQGRQEAHDYVDFVESIQNSGSEDQEKIAELEGRQAARDFADLVNNQSDDQEKVASLLQDQSVVDAVKVLKAKGLL